MTLSISKLLAEVGDANVKMQNLDECTINIDYNIKRGTKITFGTDQSVSLDGTAELGLVLWLPRKAVAAVLAKSKLEATP